MSNDYPTFSAINQNQQKEYPTFNQANPTQSIDVRLDAQGSTIQDQAIPKEIGLMNSCDPMYDVNYDSGNAKTNNNQIKNYPSNVPNYQNNVPIPNYQNNVPNYQNNIHDNSDQKYDAQNSKICNQPISKDEYKVSNVAYDSGKNKIGGNYNRPVPVPQGMNPNMPPYPQPYGLAPPHGPHGPHMLPHFPHHPHHHHHPHHLPPHFPPHFPAYPPNICPCEEDYYAYC